jgi:hypothetical protein
MRLLTSCCRCGRRFVAAGLIGLLPVCETCEFVEAAANNRPAVVHNHADADVSPPPQLPTALAPVSGTITVPPPQGIAPPPQEEPAVLSGSAVVQTVRPPARPVPPPPKPMIVMPPDVPMSDGYSGCIMSGCIMSGGGRWFMPRRLM